MVATLLAAYEQTGSLAQDDEELGSNAAAHTALPHMGERQPKGEDWLAPHVISQLAGVLLQHQCVPAESVRQLNAQLKPHQTGKHRMGLALLLAANFLMWLFLCVDMLFGNRWRYELAVWPPQEPRGLAGLQAGGQPT